MADAERVVIRPISCDPEVALWECQECVRIQHDVGWGSESVSSHILRADSIGMVTDIIDLGYVLIAEHAPSGEIMGFARVTYTSDPKKHWLHEVAVSPHVQGHGVGYRIMMELRQASSTRGASYLFFTYDPMDARNGNLYLTKCGGRGIRVFQNLYGLKKEGSSRNRLSHRLLVRWNLEAQVIPSKGRNIIGLPSVKSPSQIRRGQPFVLNIPFALSGLTEEAVAQWQTEIFPILSESINRLEYEAVDVVRSEEGSTSKLVLEPKIKEKNSDS